LLVERELSRCDNRLFAATARACTKHHELCCSGQDEAVAMGMQPLMQTDSEQLMREGIATGAATFREFLEAANWDLGDVHRTFCHQVGTAHRKLMLESLQLDPNRDFATLEWLGNTGSVALPLTMALGLEREVVSAGEHVGMLGIGSGINCIMLAIDWRKSCVGSDSRNPSREGVSRPRPRREALA
jgi:3-oxoacyl-[acyl-carrier-protein] synthase-3